MTDHKETTLKARISGMEMRKKVLMGAVGVMALAGLGVGAASAATPGPTPSSSSVQQTKDTPTAGDTADVTGAKDTPTAGDTADVTGATEATDPGEKAGTPEKAGDTGPNVQQTGNHTDPGDLPGSP